MKVLYNNLYTHFVFTTKDRLLTIEECHRPRIEKYITGVVNNHGCKMYKIYANPEHVHFLVSRAPSVSEEALADLIANASEMFINNNNLCKVKFYWQPSCSAFSVSKNDIEKVCKYIFLKLNCSFAVEYKRIKDIWKQLS